MAIPTMDFEKNLSRYTFKDSIPDYENFWKAYTKKINRKEEHMAEKKGGFRILAWALSFMIIMGVGWFGLTKFSMIKKQEKIDRGEAIVVTLVVGKVEVKKMGSTEWRTVLVEDNLQMGDAVKTASDSYCELQMVKRGIFRVESSSELYLAKLINKDDKMDFNAKLKTGGVAIKPNKLKEGENFEVETSTAVAAVRGTKFSVNVDSAGSTQIAVDEGKVAVKPVIKSIDEAATKGQIETKEAAKALQDQLVKPIEVTPGQEAKLDKATVDKLNNSIGKAIEKASEKAGPIKLEQIAQTPATAAATTGAAQPVASVVTAAIMADVRKEMPAMTGAKEASKADIPLTAAVVAKDKISDDAKQKLDTLNEDKIIDKAVDMMKVKIESKPAGALVLFDNVGVGVTPVEQIIEKGKKVSIKVSKEGFNDFAQELLIDSDKSVNAELLIVKTEESNTNTVAEATKLPGNLDWEKPMTAKLGNIDNEPVLYKGRIFVTIQNKLLVFSTEGSLLKSTTVVEEGFRLTRPVADSGKVYIGSDNGGIFAYDITGELAWKADAGSEKFGASPTAMAGIVAIPSIDKGIKVYNASGTLTASIDVSAPIYSAPLILNSGKEVVYATESGEISCYDLTTQAKKWSKNFNERFLYPLVGDDTVVTLARNSGKIMAISPADGSVIWNNQFAELQKTRINPQYLNGKVVFANNLQNSIVIVISANKGTVLAKWNLPETIGIPYVVGNSIYMGTESGKVYSYNVSEKKADWTYKSAGKISLVVGDKESVYAVSPSSMVKIVK